MTPDTDKREWLGEWIYAKFVQNYERLLEENKKLKEKLSEITMVADDEKQSIEHILELEEENKKLKEEKDFFYKSAKQFREENEKLKEDRKTLESAIWDLVRENRRLKEQRIFNSTEYDLITLTSTTPQWELRRK